MKSTTIVCLAALCLIVVFTSNVSAQLQEDPSESLDVEQFGAETDAVNPVRANLVLARNRCKTFGNCVHDRLCDSNCKQWGYKDGDCSGRYCICCA